MIWPFAILLVILSIKDTLPANLRPYYRDGIATEAKNSAYSCGCQYVCSGPLQRRFDPSHFICMCMCLADTIPCILLIVSLNDIVFYETSRKFEGVNASIIEKRVMVGEMEFFDLNDEHKC
uniref:Uncharacterized protein n=1 Tax=Vespula pensylvanica TaxID=30213 RepID=A0A834P7K0_VESPE|nr:hypothetical protein H0235_004587 [Vespula pensylvanica]